MFDVFLHKPQPETSKLCLNGGPDRKHGIDAGGHRREAEGARMMMFHDELRKIYNTTFVNCSTQCFTCWKNAYLTAKIQTCLQCITPCPFP